MKRYTTILLIVALLLTVLAGCTKSVNSVVISTDSCEIVAGETYALSYQVIPEDADLTNVVWKSANESIATVDANGTISAHAEGQTTVFVTDGKQTFATCAVTVLRKAAYDLLNDDERAFVDMALRYISDFKNPSSVEFLDICYTEGDESTESFWIVEVSAENSFGATDSSIYVLDSTYGFHSNEYFFMVPTYGPYYRISLVNEAIDDKT